VTHIRPSCENPEQERWTCPMCYADHDYRVDKCDECGAKLRCTKRRTFTARCEAIVP
jgi:hypothetical protein